MNRLRLYAGFALAAGIVLMNVVFIEPAPADWLFILLMPVGLVMGTVSRLQLFSNWPVPVLLTGYILLSLPGMIRAADRPAAIRFFAITIYLVILALYLAGQTQPDCETTWLRAYLLSAALAFGAGMAGYLGLRPDILLMYGVEMRGFFKDANVYGPFLIPAVIFLLDDWQPRRLLGQNHAGRIVLLAALTTGVILSYSRAAYLNLFTATGLYLVLRRPARLSPDNGPSPVYHLAKISRRHRLTLALAVAVLAAGALAAWGLIWPDNPLIVFFKDRASLKDYDQDRFATQLGGLRLIGQHLAGVGAGQFDREIAAVTGQAMAAHSLYIRIAAESGLGAGLAFLAALAWLLARLARTCRRNRLRPDQDGNDHSAAYLAILSGILVNSLVIDTLHWRHFWLIIGIALYGLNRPRRNRETGQPQTAISPATGGGSGG